MIDWLSFVAPLAHQAGPGGPFFNGAMVRTRRDPELVEAVDYQVWLRMPVEGSHSSRIVVASTDLDGRPALFVSGNPAKWFQGHNVFGSDDLAGLAVEMLTRVCRLFGVVPSAADLEDWRAGRIDLHRVDVTYSADLGDVRHVRAALRALDQSARLKFRGRGHFRGDSIVWGEKSRRWGITAYAKGPELEVHKLPADLAETSIVSHANRLLRWELRMLSMELQREGLRTVADWSDNTPAELHARKLAAVEVAEETMVSAEVLEGLPGRLQLTYNAWREGHDLRAMLSRPTFYRYRAELLKYGVDIAIRQTSDRPEPQRQPLRLVLDISPRHQVPDWAIGTPLYFEPRARAA